MMTQVLRICTYFLKKEKRKHEGKLTGHILGEERVLELEIPLQGKIH